jgi:hypothetical protein
MKSSPNDPANTRSNGPNLVSGTLRISDPAESSGASMSAFDLPQRSFVADHDIQVDVLP